MKNNNPKSQSSGGSKESNIFAKKDLMNNARENANHCSSTKFHIQKGAVNPHWSRKVTEDFLDGVHATQAQSGGGVRLMRQKGTQMGRCRRKHRGKSMGGLWLEQRPHRKNLEVRGSNVMNARL